MIESKDLILFGPWIKIGVELSFKNWCNKNRIEIKQFQLTDIILTAFMMDHKNLPKQIEEIEAWYKCKLKTDSRLVSKGVEIPISIFSIEKPVQDFWARHLEILLNHLSQFICSRRVNKSGILGQIKITLE